MTRLFFITLIFSLFLTGMGTAKKPDVKVFVEMQKELCMGSYLLAVDVQSARQKGVTKRQALAILKSQYGHFINEPDDPFNTLLRGTEIIEFVFEMPKHIDGEVLGESAMLGCANQVDKMFANELGDYWTKREGR